MPLESAYLANEPAAVRRSRALHRFTVASPLVLLMAVGLVGHVGRARYARPASAEGYERKISAYIPRVASVQALQKVQDQPPRKEVEAEADRWLAGYRSGELQTLKPAFYEDHLQGGPRGEVARSAYVLSDMLVLRAHQDLASGNVDQAADAALRAAQVSYGVREFESQSLLQSLLNQRRAVTVITHAWGKLSPAKKAELRPALGELRVDQSTLDQLQAEAKTLYEDYRTRQQIEESSSLDDDSERNENKALVRSLVLSRERINRLIRS